jgi:hypothetical protein
MPRRAPDTVTEHRITLGNIERQLLDDASSRGSMRQAGQEESMTAEDFAHIANGVSKLVLPIAAVGVGVLGLKVYADVRTLVDGLTINPFDKPLSSNTDLTLNDVLFGSETPKPITGDKVRLVDVDGQDVTPPKNPLAGTPAGGLFGLGMRIGQTFNPFTRWA